MVRLTGFAAGGWWTGLGVAALLIAVLAALVVTVVTLVNRIERQAGSILDNLTATGVATRPLLDIVETDVHLDTLAGDPGPEGGPGARQVAGHLPATSQAAAGLRSALDDLLPS